MNKIFLIGNISSKLEQKSTSVGKNVTVFNLAVNSGKEADFYRINVWDNLGDVCMKYLDKGSKVAVEGKLKPRLYENKGKTYMSLDVTVEEIEFLTTAKKESDQNDSFTDINPDDLPF